MQRLGEVEQVFAVRLDLRDRVLAWTTMRPGHRNELRRAFERIRLTPLLQLDHYVGVGARLGVGSDQYNVDSFACQWKPVLQHDLHIAEAGRL